MNKKKLLKKDINENGFFLNLKLNKPEVPSEWADKVPEGAIYFEGIASDGNLNRNGYIIRESAWVDAISGFMQNPVILLQHEPDDVIGTCLWARVTQSGLEVGGYVFDDLTDGRFGRGLLRALSTGHYTLAVEFEHKDTKQVISKEEFDSMPGWDKYEEFIMAVTKLEWVEFSVVSIGSNRKSLIKMKNAYEQFKNSMDEDDIPFTESEPTDEDLKKVEEEEKKEPQEEEKKENDDEQNPVTPEDKPVEEVKPEVPEEKTEEKIEEKEPENTVPVEDKPISDEKVPETTPPAKDFEEEKPKEEDGAEILPNGISLVEITDTMNKIIAENKTLEEQNKKLMEAIKNIPLRKSSITIDSVKKAEKSKPQPTGWLKNLLDSRGIEV